MYLRIKSNNISATIAFMEKTIRSHVPDYPFEYSFLDEILDRSYKNEHITGSLINYITILAIFISCLGLAGLTSFTVERRTKEIGIRKTLGSSISGITLLLTKDFVKWVILANLIALPAAWYFVNKWLQSFAYKTTIDWFIFMFAGSLVLIISLITTSYQTIRAARANPVEALRYE